LHHYVIKNKIYKKMEEQIKHYENKLAFEMDPSDLFDALNNEENIASS